jgi:hypothetical protein
VHLNYPELTSHSIASGFNTLTGTEKQSLQKKLLASMPQLRKAFGPSIANALQSVMEQHPETVKNATHPHKPHVHHSNVGQLHFRKYYFHAYHAGLSQLKV